MVDDNQNNKREIMEFDVAVVGAGVAGLSAAIRLRQLSADTGQDLQVCVVEKASEVGAHILSGAVLEPRALDELIPDWQDKQAPLDVAVQKDEFLWLGKKGKKLKLPTPPQMKNHGNYIVSLGNFSRWLASQAEALGVQIFAGFPAADVIIEGGEVKGILTGEFGVAEDGSHKDIYQPAMELRAKYTVFAEGCRGSISEKLMKEFNLRDGVEPQTYGLGIKELWEISPDKHELGKVTHTVGFPLENDTYGGSFIYHLSDNQLAIGYVVGLDYSNPHLSPYDEFQKFKTHSYVADILEGGRRISYGARALNEGGFQSIPKLSFAGGVLVGCAAGFLNAAKIKGTHTAMKSGMLAAEAIAEELAKADADAGKDLVSYEQNFKKSWVYGELKKVRNIRPAFRRGLWFGLFNAVCETLTMGLVPWTLKHHKDHESLKLAKDCTKPEYPKPDGKLVFDRLESVQLSATNHAENQPIHLTLKDKGVPVEHNLALYDAPEQRYCPAGVYEILENDQGENYLQINSQNCVHCKSCDIKDPMQNIVWTTPEGGGGPNYGNM